MPEKAKTANAPAQTDSSKKSSGGLSSKLLPELRSIARGLGIKTSGKRKAELVAAIQEAQGGAAAARSQTEKSSDKKGASSQPKNQPQDKSTTSAKGSQAAKAAADSESQRSTGDRKARNETDEKASQARGGGNQRGSSRGDQPQGDDQGASQKDKKDQSKGQGRDQAKDQQKKDERAKSDNRGGGDDSDDNRRSRRRRRPRDRSSRGRGGREPDLNILEDDVLTPCAGILDPLDNYAFLRTTGYLTGAEDVYVSLAIVRNYGLRRGDAITGQVRAPREGERREKYSPLVRIDSVNGADPDMARSRADFDDLTPVHPSQRLKFETTADEITGRVLDLAAPTGKGQRTLIAAPVGSGRTTVLRTVAQAVNANNPQAHLMVVLLDARPEEVTEFERTVRGEVISSTFDRPPADHVMAAELAVERAKRLVELGHEVVLLCDGISQLGRAYNLTLPAGGRVLAGDFDVAALHPTKRFLGAARKIEDGGSLTVIATATVGSGLRIDEVIFEEVQHVSNAELWLRDDLSRLRVFPAVDLVRSRTRNEELFVDPEEVAQLTKLRQAMMEGDAVENTSKMLTKLQKTATNADFLAEIKQARQPSDILKG